MNKTLCAVSILGLGFIGAACSSDEGPGDGGSGGSGPASGGSTTPGSGGSTTPGAGGSTTPGAGGSTTPGAGGSTTPGAGGGGGVTNTGGGGVANTGGGGGVANTGGQPGSGGSNPDPDPDPGAVPPPLIITTEANPWDTSVVPTMGAGAATITVDPNAENQVWHGFGGTFNEAGWAALMAIPEADRLRAIELLFGAEDGANFTWGRIPIGPSDYAVERYSLSSGPGMFDISHDEDYLIPYIAAAQAVKTDIRFWGSPWSPPPWAKIGGENGGYDKGYADSAQFEDYAQYFVDWVTAYEAKGIPIDHVQPQNEPGYSQSYPTCAFGTARDTESNGDVYTDQPFTLGTFVDSYLFPALEGAGLSTGVWFGTLSNAQLLDQYWDSMSDKASASKLGGIGVQWGGVGSTQGFKSDGYLVMNTEHRCGNYPWQEDPPAGKEYWLFTGNAEQTGPAPNNYDYGRETWDHLVDSIDRGVNIYSAWNMVLDKDGRNLDTARPWYQNALLVADDNALTVTPAYYVFRHLAQYVRPGAVRIGDNSEDALAFKNTDGSIIVALHNRGAESAMSVSDGTTTYEFTMPALGFATAAFNIPTAE